VKQVGRRERERLTIYGSVEKAHVKVGLWRWRQRSRSVGRPERGREKRERERGKSETVKCVGGEMNFPPTRLIF
jgi:hypothetical protein